MSLGASESLEGSASRKGTASPIRQFLVRSSSSAPSFSSTETLSDKNPTKKPLAEPDLNKQKVETKKKPEVNTRPQGTPTVAELLGATKKVHTLSSLASAPTRPSGLKRSYSAVSSLDTVNEAWLSSPISKKHGRLEKKELYDRFITRVPDMASAQVLMSKTQPTNYTETEGAESYQEQVANACGYYPNKRILNFQHKAPINTKVDILKNTRPKLNTNPSPSIKRQIYTSAEKCLDAPYMTNDYYLNLLDWSVSNVVAVGLENSVYLWNADNGTIQALDYDLNKPVTSLSYSADGNFLAVGTDNGDTQIWDIETNKKMRSMMGQDNGGRVGTLSWNNYVVSSGYRDGSIFNHDVRVPNHLVKEMHGHVDEVCGLKWRAAGDLLASGGNDNTVNIWDIRTTAPKFSKQAHMGAIKALSWCPWSSNLLATGGGRDDKSIFFWNTTVGTRLGSINTGSQVTSLHWSGHYKEVVSTHGAPHNQISVWEYTSKNKIVDIPAHDTRILHSAMSPDGQVLATAAADDSLKFWRIFESNGKPRLASDSSRSKDSNEIRLKRSKSLR